MSDADPSAAPSEAASDVQPSQDDVDVADQHSPDASESVPPIELPEDPAELVAAFASLAAERDSYLDAAQRIQAEFDNFRKRTSAEGDVRVRNGVARIAEALLPVLDALDAAMGQGDESAGPLRTQLFTVLEREGLERVGSAGEPFDPNLHEAVLHEEGDGGEPVVIEELRPGYRWNGRVLRAAMVKVRN